MKPFLLASLVLAVVLGLVLVLVLGGENPSEQNPLVTGIPGKLERSLPAPPPPPPAMPERTEVPDPNQGLDPETLKDISREAALEFGQLRKIPVPDWVWDSLEEKLEKTGRIKFFGPFSRDDFPEITTPQQAITLANALTQADIWPETYKAEAGNPRRKDVEDAVMKLLPRLIVETSPLFHWERLTNFSREFPQEAVSPVRRLWRDALVRQELIRSEKDLWLRAYGIIFNMRGVKYFPKSETEENVFPPLEAINKKLQANRETYLRNLERLFREHGLLDDR